MWGVIIDTWKKNVFEYKKLNYKKKRKKSLFVLLCKQFLHKLKPQQSSCQSFRQQIFDVEK